jgi:ketosteroid isomerase-like protein
MMQRRTLLSAACAAPLLPALASCASTHAGAPKTLDATELAKRKAEVTAAETAFAKTMADRDFSAFMTHIADDAIFINGKAPLRGKAAIGAFWKQFFEKPAAPFAWKPEVVEVLATGDIAYSDGPVTNPAGAHFMTYVSTWRRESNGKWLVVLDNGFVVPPKP